MKKTKKIMQIILILAFVVGSISTSVLGFDYNTFSPNTNDTGKIQNVGNTIISTVRVIGMILSVGVLMILGIKYMMGSAEEKAEYKKTMIPYIVGAILIFAATFIVGAIFEFANKV